ncbi:MAG: MoxR family ATPase [Deltaproteobacteria bacterium]|nr:MoxR family ATPase [Deltaproteobacteria bacterium]MBW2417731.1 MoxR family ATPase [Deltaproteobacteria bacterium]
MEPDGVDLCPARATELAGRLLQNITLALRGKPEVVLRATVTLLARGHLLIEDVPGVGKTTLARALALSVDAQFNRIQFTSDLLPGDLTGLSLPELVNGQRGGHFGFQPGPLFANVVLADEVNRASPKSQSALLEAMSENTVSVDGVTHDLPDPFFVVATQNPLEHHGTHPLPESQLDRFLMRVAVGYPSRDFEADVLREDPAANALPRLESVVSLDELRAMQAAARKVKFDDTLIAYLLEVVEETRQHEALELGVSPRGALAWRRAAQSRALVDGRDFCIPEDLRELAVDVLAHRVSANLRSGAVHSPEETGWIVQEILGRVPVPF